MAAVAATDPAMVAMTAMEPVVATAMETEARGSRDGGGNGYNGDSAYGEVSPGGSAQDGSWVGNGGAFTSGNGNGAGIEDAAGGGGGSPAGRSDKGSSSGDLHPLVKAAITILDGKVVS